MSIKKLFSTYCKDHRTIRRVEKRSTKTHEALIREIRSGETTGDRLQDFALLFESGPQGRIYRDLAEMQKALKPLRGEFASIRWDDKPEDLPIAGSPVKLHVQRPLAIWIGVLEDDQLILDMTSFTWRLPMSSVWSSQQKRVVPLGSLELRWNSLIDQGTRPRGMDPPIGLCGHPWSIRYGDQGVEEHILSAHSITRGARTSCAFAYVDAAKVFGREPQIKNSYFEKCKQAYSTGNAFALERDAA